jgi:hypothetical protein
MGAQYQIVLKDPNAVTLAIPQNIFYLEYARRVNQIGAMTLQIPIIYDPYCLIDGQIELYRQVDSGPLYLEGETRWFIRKISHKLDDNGQEYIELYAEDAMTLLQRRITAFYAGSSQVVKSAVAADDLLKTIVSNNMGSAAVIIAGPIRLASLPRLFLPSRPTSPRPNWFQKTLPGARCSRCCRKLRRHPPRPAPIYVLTWWRLWRGLLNLEPTSISAGWITAGRAVITRSS